MTWAARAFAMKRPRSSRHTGTPSFFRRSRRSGTHVLHAAVKRAALWRMPPQDCGAIRSTRIARAIARERRRLSFRCRARSKWTRRRPWAGSFPWGPLAGWTRRSAAKTMCRQLQPLGATWASLGSTNAARRGSDPAQQPERNRQVEQVEGEAVDERRAVGAGEIEDRARHPAAERHAEERRHQDHAEARACLAGFEMLAHDQGVGGHDATLEQAEERRYDVQGDKTVERQEEQQRDPLQHRAEQQRAQAADVIGDPPRGKPADDAEAEHQ